MHPAAHVSHAFSQYSAVKLTDRGIFTARMKACGGVSPFASMHCPAEAEYRALGCVVATAVEVSAAAVGANVGAGVYLVVVLVGVVAVDVLADVVVTVGVGAVDDSGGDGDDGEDDGEGDASGTLHLPWLELHLQRPALLHSFIAVCLVHAFSSACTFRHQHRLATNKAGSLPNSNVLQANGSPSSERLSVTCIPFKTSANVSPTPYVTVSSPSINPPLPCSYAQIRPASACTMVVAVVVDDAALILVAGVLMILVGEDVVMLSKHIPHRYGQAFCRAVPASRLLHVAASTNEHTLSSIVLAHTSKYRAEGNECMVFSSSSNPTPSRSPASCPPPTSVASVFTAAASSSSPEPEE